MKTITVLLTTVLFSMSASAALTPACEEYYKEIDNFVAKMKEIGTPEAQVVLAPLFPDRGCILS
ncbi:TPA: hypothetical protein ACNCH7_004973 [Escherichia coli]